MNLLDEMKAMEGKLASLGFSVSDLCEAAGIAQTTWWRWKEERFSPRLKVWLDVSAAFHRLTAGTASVVAPHDVALAGQIVSRGE